MNWKKLQRFWIIFAMWPLMLFAVGAALIYILGCAPPGGVDAAPECKAFGLEVGWITSGLVWSSLFSYITIPIGVVGSVATTIAEKMSK